MIIKAPEPPIITLIRWLRRQVTGRTAACPMCAEPIHPEATICPFCRSTIR